MFGMKHIINKQILNISQRIISFICKPNEPSTPRSNSKKRPYI